MSQGAEGVAEGLLGPAENAISAVQVALHLHQQVNPWSCPLLINDVFSPSGSTRQITIASLIFSLVSVENWSRASSIMFDQICPMRKQGPSYYSSAAISWD